MSGTHAKWTKERRAKQAARMRKLNADRTFTEKRIGACKGSPYRLARLRALIANVNEKRAANAAIYDKWVAAIRAASLKPKRLKQLKRQMAEVSRRPERRQASRAFITALNKCPVVRRKSIATRRGGDIPDELLPLFLTIRPKVGLREAMRVIQAEMARAA